jgi:hypothetical protein
MMFVALFSTFVGCWRSSVRANRVGVTHEEEAQTWTLAERSSTDVQDAFFDLDSIVGLAVRIGHQIADMNPLFETLARPDVYHVFHSGPFRHENQARTVPVLLASRLQGDANRLKLQEACI